MRQFVRVLSALSVGCLIYASASALDVPARPKGYVTDQADILSPAAEAKIERGLRSFEASTSNQVIVATFSSLEDGSLEDFSMRLAEQWKPGQKDKDNGVILLIFHNDRKMRIEVGYGLEGALPDALAGMIIQNEIAPRFREGQYEAGVLYGLQAIMEAIQGEYTPSRQRVSRTGYGNRRTLTPEELAVMRKQGMVGSVFILIAVLGLFIWDLLRYRRYKHDHQMHNKGYSFWEWFFRFAVLLAVLSFVFRMMFYMMLFSRGGYGGSRGGGGGFSGGGGSFGGGGASGGW